MILFFSATGASFLVSVSTRASFGEALLSAVCWGLSPQPPSVGFHRIKGTALPLLSLSETPIVNPNPDSRFEERASLF